MPVTQRFTYGYGSFGSSRVMLRLAVCPRYDAGSTGMLMYTGSSGLPVGSESMPSGSLSAPSAPIGSLVAFDIAPIMLLAADSKPDTSAFAESTGAMSADSGPELGFSGISAAGSGLRTSG